MCQHSRRSPNPGMKSQQHQGSAGPHPKQRCYQSPRTPKTRQSPNILQMNVENVHKGASQGHKMTLSRKSSSVSQSVPKLNREDYMNNNHHSGNRSAGSSPMKQLFIPGVESNSVPFENGSNNWVKSRSLTPPSKFQYGEGRASPSRSPVTNLAYAGAKFSDPPSPKVLPKPPTHWFLDSGSAINSGISSSCAEITCVLKGMLKVQC